MFEQDPPLEVRQRLLDRFNAGQHAVAEVEAQALVGDFPRSGLAWLILGAAQNAQGKEAMGALQRAARLLPQSADVQFNLGLAEQRAGHLERAVERYRQAVALNSDLPLAHYNLGVGLQTLGRLEEAVAAYGAGLAVAPAQPEAWNNLAMAHRALGREDEAIACYRRALEFDPVNAQANLVLSSIFMKQRRFIEVEQLCRKALAIQPDFAEMRENLSRILAYLSDYEQVVAESDRAFALKPDHPQMWEQRLYSFSYHPDLSVEAIFSEFVRWGDRFPDPVVDFSAHDRTPGRKLRIGYVSPDFRAHSSRFYFWPLFTNHDRSAFELYAYSNVQEEVTWTRLFRGQFEHWRDIRRMDDQAVARLVREDQIDILVDLCNHMQDDRLGVFTLKPAPIQATWLGAAWTTGLKTIDWVLYDPHLAPEGTIAREAILRLPDTFLAYRPPEETADLVSAPCLKNGHITFGYSGRTERLNHRTFRAWAKILERLPDAKLILDYGPFGDPPTRAYYEGFLARHGLDLGRVIMRCSPRIYEGLNDIDILLDSFPHSGGTMLMDAFWMGLPAVTLASRPPLGRIGTSMLMNLGLPDWIATTEAEYIDKACAFAGQPQALNELRLGFRDRMRACPLMDGPAFARGMEDAYRFMYDHWRKEAP
jgi:predicted O-linked N-acetylglucosamine transferase (SPINDLY family)